MAHTQNTKRSVAGGLGVHRAIKSRAEPMSPVWDFELIRSRRSFREGMKGSVAQQDRAPVS